MLDIPNALPNLSFYKKLQIQGFLAENSFVIDDEISDYKNYFIKALVLALREAVGFLGLCVVPSFPESNVQIQRFNREKLQILSQNLEQFKGYLSTH